MQDTAPFRDYLKSFERCHDVIESSIEFFIRKLEKRGKAGREDLLCESYEEAAMRLEKVIKEQWLEFDSMLSAYVSNPRKNKTGVISTKGALVINTMRFAVKNLMVALSEFAQCTISSATM